MGLVRVWNDNKYDFKQEFMGESIHIPAGKYVVLEEGFAHEFKSAFYPIKKDVGGVQDPRSYKMIRLERTDKLSEVKTADIKPEFKCHKCGHNALNAVDLDDHLINSHLEDFVDKEEALQSFPKAVLEKAQAASAEKAKK